MAWVVAAPIASDFRGKFTALPDVQQDAAAIGPDPLERQVENPFEQLVDVERATDRLGRLIHQLKVIGARGERRTSGVLAVARDNPRKVGGGLVADGDRRRDRRPCAGGVEQYRAADLDAIAGAQRGVFRLLRR